MAEDPPRDFSEAPTRAEVLASTRAGSPEATRKMLYYQQPVRAFLASIGCPPSELDDLSQDLLLRLQERIAPAFPGTGSFRAYFKQAIRNRLRDVLRRRQREPRSPRSPDELAAKTGPDLEAALARGCGVLRRHFEDSEEPAGAELLVKALLEGRPLKALAAELGLSPRGLRGRWKKGARCFDRWAEGRLGSAWRDALDGRRCEELFDGRQLSAGGRIGLLTWIGLAFEEGRVEG